MHDTVIVGALQCIAHRRHDAQRLLRRQTLRLQELPEIQTINELHEQKVESARLAKIVHANDVRMIQRGEGMRLFFKTDRELGIVRTLGCQQFQGDEAVEGFLPRLVDDPHAAATEAFQNFELRKMRGQFLGRDRRDRRGVLAAILCGSHDLRHETARAEALRCAGHLGATLWADGGWKFAHAGVLKWPRRNITRFFSRREP